MTAAPEVDVEAPAGLAPGIYADLDTEAYHRDPALSSSGARKLLPPSCPAIYRWEADHPQPAKKAFDVGNAAHKLILGIGPKLRLVDYDRWDSTKAKVAVADARAAGDIPLKRADWDQVHAMADVLRKHHTAGPLFTPDSGIAERSLFWNDPDTGVGRRARPDWIKPLPGMTVVVDYKTATDASPAGVEKAIADRGYYQQDPWYLDGLRALGLADDTTRFLLVFQHKSPPYPITVREISDRDRQIGAAKNRRALEIYARCQATGRWPDWDGDIDHIPTAHLPTWASIRESEEYL